MLTSLDFASELFYLNSLTTTDPDPKRFHAIASALAEHVEGPPAGLGWWCKAMGGPDGSSCTIADVARTAAVPYAHAYYARYAMGERDRVAAVLSAERDAVFSRVLDRGESLAREMAKLVEAFGSAEAKAEARALLDTYARARMPIRFTLPTDVDAPQVEQIQHYEPIECAGCHHVWTPRVPRPVKCPVCQRIMRYVEATVPEPVSSE